MKLRQKEFLCPKCNGRQTFTELEWIYPKISGNYIWETWAEETGALNPSFICSNCHYSEKLEYLEYPSRKPPHSILRNKWLAFYSNIKRKWGKWKSK